MKETIQVSVVVVTYNSNIGALKQTLDSIVCQRGVTWEVILTDDGSQEKDFSWLQDYFAIHQIQHYRLLENPENLGTIRNILQGVQIAKGKYVYTIAPGDFLFDECVLRDFCVFAEQKKCDMCFGNAVYYSAEDGTFRLTQGGQSVPRRPEAYNCGRFLGKMNFFFGDWICGVAYFHKRESWLVYLQQAAEICRYAEDASTTALALCDGVRLWYYDRHIAWYEDGSGISTSGSSKWQYILYEEYKMVFSTIQKKHPKDPMPKIAFMDYMELPQWKIRLRRLLRYPIIMIVKILLLPKNKQRILTVTQQDFLRLGKLLSGENV